MNKCLGLPILAFAGFSLMACSAMNENDSATTNEPVERFAAPGEQQLRASGNEPFWSLQVFAEQIHFHRMGEEAEVFALTSQTQSPETSRYRFSSNAYAGTLVVQAETCHDSMTGMPYPYTASVQIPGETLHGCAGDPSQLLQVNPWQFYQLDTHAVADLVLVTLYFDGERVSGSTGCNRYFGGYELTGENLVFGNLGVTKMACDGPRNEAEQAFLAVINDVHRFDIDAEGHLILHSSHGQTLKAKPYTPEK
ncbi:MAG: META domain-containing protein [Aliidiomarina sp.]|uniref:META domain-containing protein n=1 Tax=Aliidiomarina sp. TaxID=1872439 RepID=UPI0025C49E79|nr:META domain-containing protein [Aliidiomarina sp.]MCH8500842.1 META domain-containing protein [Aliidiomarina sp.]